MPRGAMRVEGDDRGLPDTKRFLALLDSLRAGGAWLVAAVWVEKGGENPPLAARLPSPQMARLFSRSPSHRRPPFPSLRLWLHSCLPSPCALSAPSPHSPPFFLLPPTPRPRRPVPPPGGATACDDSERHELALAAELFDWSKPLVVTRAPGRLDVMGGIADYSGSLVLQVRLRCASGGPQVDLRCASGGPQVGPSFSLSSPSAPAARRIRHPAGNRFRHCRLSVSCCHS
ncbi:unnamed protein product [Closterium sp. NIES-54]